MKRFADARDVVPQPFRVAGVELRPFCLGHHLLFKALGLPFCGNPEADCGTDDIKLGIAICGLTYEQGLEAVHSGSLPEIIAEWRKAVCGPWWNPRKIDDAATEQAFRDYLAIGYSMPPTWTHGGKSFDLTAPWEVLLKTRLVMAGFSESDVVNGYLPGKWYEYFCAMELEQAHRCSDLKQWKPVFFTKQDAERME